MIVKCTVTQEMIDKNCHEPYNCPIAEAIELKLRAMCYVQVSHFAIHIYVGSKWEHTIKILPLLACWLFRYDANKKYAIPIEFELDIPESYLK